MWHPPDPRRKDLEEKTLPQIISWEHASSLCSFPCPVQAHLLSQGSHPRLDPSVPAKYLPKPKLVQNTDPQSSCGNCSSLTPTLNFILGSTYSHMLPNPQILVVDQGVEIHSHWAKPRASSWSLNFKSVSISLVPLQSRILSVAVSHHE